MSHRPIIKMPKYMARKLAKIRAVREAQERNQQSFRSRLPGSPILVIACKNTKLNHYFMQDYRHLRTVPLASLHWHSNKFVGDYFRLVRYDKNPAVSHVDEEDDASSFERFNLAPEILKAVKEKYKRPTVIQELAIPTISKHRNTMFAAETGCGKTLAYAAPLLSFLTMFKSPVQSETTIFPLALVMAPTQVLVDQIGSMMKQIAQYTNIKIDTALEISNQPTSIFHPETKVLVGVPGAVAKSIETGATDLSQLQHMVIDETDTMVEEKCGDIVHRILKQVKIQEHNEAFVGTATQLVLTSATLPPEIQASVGELLNLGNLDIVRTNALHKLMPHVDQLFVRVKRDSKPEHLLKMVRHDAALQCNVMVFVNKAATAHWLKHFLMDSSIVAYELSEMQSAQQRIKQFKLFNEGSGQVLVTTNVGSRGLDTINVDHVINYEMPEKMADYIHRVGRVGRVGAMKVGHVTNLISRKPEMELVRIIEYSCRQSGNLKTTTANMTAEEREEHERLNIDLTTENVLHTNEREDPPAVRYDWDPYPISRNQKRT